MSPPSLPEERVFALVRDAVALVCEVDPAGLSRSTRLVEDLAADSLALVEIVEVTEVSLREHGIAFAFDDERLDALATVGDLVGEVLAQPAPASLAAA